MYRSEGQAEGGDPGGAVPLAEREQVLADADRQAGIDARQRLLQLGAGAESLRGVAEWVRERGQRGQAEQHAPAAG